MHCQLVKYKQKYEQVTFIFILYVRVCCCDIRGHSQFDFIKADHCVCPKFSPNNYWKYFKNFSKTKINPYSNSAFCCSKIFSLGNYFKHFKNIYFKTCITGPKKLFSICFKVSSSSVSEKIFYRITA